MHVTPIGPSPGLPSVIIAPSVGASIIMPPEPPLPPDPLIPPEPPLPPDPLVPPEPAGWVSSPQPASATTINKAANLRTMVSLLSFTVRSELRGDTRITRAERHYEASF